MANDALEMIRSEMSRVATKSMRASMDTTFDPNAGPLVKVELEAAHWHLQPQEFLVLLRTLPDGAGDEAVRTAIEKKATGVWRGPAPSGSRDTSSI